MRTLLLREDYYLICGQKHLEALLLDRLLRDGDFNVGKQYSLHDFCRDTFTCTRSALKVQFALQRLCDKGFLKYTAVMASKHECKVWQVYPEKVARALDQIAKDVKLGLASQERILPHSVRKSSK